MGLNSWWVASVILCWKDMLVLLQWDHISFAHCVIRLSTSPLSRWLERGNLRPRIVGEFDDSALMKAFGKAGAGVFPAPTATPQEVENQYGVVWLGETKEIRERFFAISVERRIVHPAVRAVSEAAQGGPFAAGKMT